MTAPSPCATGRSAVAAGTAFPLRLQTGASSAGNEGAVPPAERAAGALHDPATSIPVPGARSVSAAHPAFTGLSRVPFPS